MNFSQFALNNVMRNIKSYLAYFLSMSISAALFFSFSMFIFHPNLNGGISSINVASGFLVVEIIAYVFLIFFVFYSASVFLKGRYNEFGTLFMIGISKKQLNKLILLENMIISTLSVVLGLIFGLVFSKFLLIVVSKLLDLDLLKFYFPSESIILTTLSFLLLGVIISGFTSFIVKENEVLKLLKGTKSPKKEPKTSLLFSLLSIVLLVVGYYLSSTATIDNLANLMIPVTAMVIVATYFLFSQFSVFAINILKNNRNFYTKGLNLIWISNLFYKIKDNSRMFFIIAITSAVSFSSIGAFYAYWKQTEELVSKYYPQTFFYATFSDLKSGNEHIDFLEKELNDKSFKYNKITGELKAYVNSDGGYLDLGLISESNYNKLASSQNLNKVDLNNNETLIFSEGTIKDSLKINKSYKIKEVSNKALLPESFAYVAVLDDKEFNKVNANYNIELDNKEFDKMSPGYNKEIFAAYYMDNQDKTLDIGKSFNEKFGFESDEHLMFSYASEIDTSKKAVGLYLFAATFIGLIFFFTTGSFIYNKIYTDVIEDKKKYRDMSKLGLSYKEIKKIVTIEIGILFLLPYIVAVIHSSFALSSLPNAYNIKVTGSAFLVMGSFLLIQILYFLIIRTKYLMEIKQNLI